MGNKDHLKELEKGAKSWNRWRKDNPSIMPDLRSSNLWGLSLQRYDLRNANLSGSELGHVYFQNANLHGADLSCCSLSKADFTEADLSFSYLTGSNLEHALFSRSNLTKCDLSFSRLFWSTFEESNIEQANFTQAIFEETRLLGMDITDASTINKSLISTSSLDINTLFRSSSQHELLIGFGIPELLVDYLPSFSKTAISFYSAFISYSKTNSNMANAIHDALSEEGINCWLDSKQILPGDDIAEAIDKGVRIWDKFILCCSKESLSSWWVDNEINKALLKEQEIMKKKGQKISLLIPIDLDGYLFTDNYLSGFKSELVRRLAGDFSSVSAENISSHQELKRLITALRVDNGGRPLTPESKL
jgi:uncharacterized protein YjbI with pentapeptide repeats